MPNVKCPGCQTLLSLDTTAASAFECPRCGKQLRLKSAVLDVSATLVGAPTRESDDPTPLRRKKKKRRDGPPSEISPFLMPLGGVAILAWIGLNLMYVSREAEKAKVEGAAVAIGCLIMIVMMVIGLAIGAATIQFAVNSMGRRRRVPNIEFLESACLYTLVSFAGMIGAWIVALPLVVMTAPGPAAGPADRDRVVVFQAVVLGIGAILGFVAAAAPTIKLMLNTSWRDAAAVAVRFLLVSTVLVILLGLVFFVVMALVFMPRR